MKVKIITDSMSDIPKKIQKELNIRVVPLTVHFGDRTYIDGIDINSEKFFNLLEVSNNLPTTSQVSPGIFEKIFREELEHCDKLIVINGSSKLSGTYNSARIAASEFYDGDVTVIDSLLVTFAQGFLVIKAARMLKQGKSAEEVIEEVINSRQRIRCLFAVDTLKYLLKGGRLSLVQAIAGTILNVKPILTMVDGELKVIEKVRGMKNALSFIENYPIVNNIKLDGKVIGINHAVQKNAADALEKDMKNKYKLKEVLKSEVGSVVGTHSGPGCVAAYFEVDNLITE